MRRSQLHALLAGGVLLAFLSGGSVSSAPALEPAPLPDVAAAASTTTRVKGWLVSELQTRNPRLGSVRSRRIASAIVRCTDAQQVPDLTPQLMLAVMFQESDARPGVTSPKGAVGLMQVMPYVYYGLLDLPGSIGHLESNVEAGCLVLAGNIRRLGLRAGVSSYFWGNAIVSDSYANEVDALLRDLEPAATASRTGTAG